ncbi:nucleoporin Nup133 [Naegleria gruberi]|uniref:Nucleoporin Nup133 n=1 Tax=Naegleria gruberi TaxID=5762 RepID=D2VL55_NAEGR|nr:nucleoporin Nup133 [Naegleria gruberi]EFC42559.1 nucleoporin Nup133 [Naegleria gruberi]|eukprot:XP_002675303.1 nucleoporin Nup133 [Naegleria gruberi strain NEG-M]
MAYPFPAHIRNDITNAGIHHSGITWVLDGDKLYVWNVKKFLLESENSPVLCLENVPLSESDKYFVTILGSSDDHFSIFTCSAQGKFKYWYDLSLNNDDSRFKYEIGNILDFTSFSSDGKLNINCIVNSLSSNNNIYIGTECGHFIEIELLSNGAVNLIKEKKVYGNQNTSSVSNEGLFSWFTSWTKPTTIKYFEPESLLSIQSSKTDLLILTEKCISKYTEQGKDLCWRKDISHELQSLNMIRNYSLRLLDFNFDEQTEQIYLLTCMVPEPLDTARSSSTIEYLLWPIQINDNIVVESPIRLDKCDFSEINSKFYSKCQIMKSCNRLYVHTLNSITVIEDNKIITQCDYNGIISLGDIMIDGLDGCLIDKSGNFKALRIVKLEDSMSLASNCVDQSMDQESDSDPKEAETTLANKVLSNFRKREKISSLNFIRSSVFGPSIVRASQMLVDSIPTSGSLIIDAEMIYYDKLSILILRSLQKKMDEYMDFLQYLVDYQIIENLSEEDLRIILQNGEKLFVCIKLRELQNQLGSKSSQDLIIQAMNLCCEEANFTKSQCNVENFYILVSRVESLIYQIQSEKIISSQTTYNTLSLVNQVFLCFSEGILEFRKVLNRFGTNIKECGSTWTIDKPGLLITRFFEQFERSASNLSASESKSVPQILNQMYEIADFTFSILQTMKEKEVSHFQTFNFEAKRDLIIGTFRKMKDVGEISPKTFALTLAEKYRDFKHLIQIAEENYPTEKERTVKYSHYVKRYKDFATYLLTYLRDSKKYHELLANNWSFRCGEQMASVIEPNSNLKWLHYIQVGNLGEVESSLADLSDDYSQNILPLGELGTTRNRLSLLKLASVANNNFNTANSASYFLKLTYYQAQLATDLAIEEPNQNWANESYKGAVDLLISIYKGIPSDNRVIMENQQKLLDRLLIATDIYCDFYEKETEVEEQTKLDILLNIYTSSFYVSKIEINSRLAKEAYHVLNQHIL